MAFTFVNGFYKTPLRSSLLSYSLTFMFTWPFSLRSCCNCSIHCHQHTCAYSAATLSTFAAPTLRLFAPWLLSRRGLILMNHLLWVVISWHSECWNINQKLLLLKRKGRRRCCLCSSTVPGNIVTVFATLLPAAHVWSVGVRDWARDPAVGNKTQFNHQMEKREQKALSNIIVTSSWQRRDIDNESGLGVDRKQ